MGLKIGKKNSREVDLRLINICGNLGYQVEGEWREKEEKERGKGREGGRIGRHLVQNHEEHNHKYHPLVFRGWEKVEAHILEKEQPRRKEENQKGVAT